MDFLLRRSMKENMPVEIIYDKGNEFSKRMINVFEIEQDHVKAFCYTRNQMRTFRTERILAVAPVQIVKNYSLNA
ncbi:MULTISPECIES: hypothetical protein [Bacillus]|uniref:WYL domain-containing protein n=2 Tax=Bacillus TaxID=1386 RepID=A0A0M5JAQ3_9BACI|nr:MULTISPECIES: hypothetical protein [Bacillus]ALC83394.1 hypothetical protein AM592_18945 [Bacillus gobiensis]MBP1082321.1 putative DNA-binding transcriptional regulator YafY [Bacillus capparidis]MED1097419.1 hypothetical protein [Bacillus capparidis]